MVGEGRSLPTLITTLTLPDARNDSESFGNLRESSPFGTEESLVQIQSPRPKSCESWPVFLREDRPFVFMDR